MIMKKNEVFAFIAPNGVKVTAVCLYCMGTMGNDTQYLCYAQNRLFVLKEYLSSWIDEDTGEACQSTEWECSRGAIVDNCILPDYDIVLEAHSNDSEEHLNEAIKSVISFGYSKKEAISILNGKNPDGTEFIQLPF